MGNAVSRSTRLSRRQLRLPAIIGILGTTPLALVASADPQGIIATPDIVEPNLGQCVDETGAYSVNTRTGSAGYRYAFQLPPARGAGPELALSYTSSGAIP